MDRKFTAHVELSNGQYHTFEVVAPTIQQAWKIADSRIAPEHTLRGVTENGD